MPKFTHHTAILALFLFFFPFNFILSTSISYLSFVFPPFSLTFPFFLPYFNIPPPPK
jgi:hypothetical protein